MWRAFAEAEGFDGHAAGGEDEKPPPQPLPRNEGEGQAILAPSSPASSPLGRGLGEGLGARS